ncbi:MAG: lysis system i-spanin subunit Rz [Comamonas sp.]
MTAVATAPVRAYIFIAVLLVGAALGGVAAWRVQAWRLGEQIAKVEARELQAQSDHAKQLGALATTAREVAALVAKSTQLNAAAIAAVDKQLMGELYAEKQDADRMRNCIAAGTCGVRIITKQPLCPSSPGHGSGGIDASPGGVGDAAQSLDAVTGLRVLDLRSSIREDDRKLRYLQAFAQKCGGIADQNQQVDLRPR